MSLASAKQFRGVFSRVIKTQATTSDLASIADAAGTTVVINVPGAKLGDFVLAACTADLQDVTVTAYVQATDLVELRLQNESTAARDFPALTFNLVVLGF